MDVTGLDFYDDVTSLHFFQNVPGTIQKTPEEKYLFHCETALASMDIPLAPLIEEVGIADSKGHLKGMFQEISTDLPKDVKALRYLDGQEGTIIQTDSGMLAIECAVANQNTRYIPLTETETQSRIEAAIAEPVIQMNTPLPSFLKDRLRHHKLVLDKKDAALLLDWKKDAPNISLCASTLTSYIEENHSSLTLNTMENLLLITGKLQDLSTLYEQLAVGKTQKQILEQCRCPVVNFPDRSCDT